MIQIKYTRAGDYDKYNIATTGHPYIAHSDTPSD